ncbi:MAG: hypothetical protein ACREMN_12255 [Gemmatimonadales bacterium]
MIPRRPDGRTPGRPVVGLLAIVLAVGPAGRPAVGQDTLPTGFGTLRRDDIVVRFATPTLEIHVLPLDPQVIRLLAVDTYRSLAELVRSRADEIADASGRAGLDSAALVMVTFLGVVPQARFNPEDLSITSRGRLFRPAGIVPLSPTWGTHQLEARQQAAAIYLFEPGIAFAETLSVGYESLTSDAWSRSLRLLEQERVRVRARARTPPPAPAP